MHAQLMHCPPIKDNLKSPKLCIIVTRYLILDSANLHHWLADANEQGQHHDEHTVYFNAYLIAFSWTHKVRHRQVCTCRRTMFGKAPTAWQSPDICSKPLARTDIQGMYIHVCICTCTCPYPTPSFPLPELSPSLLFFPWPSHYGTFHWVHSQATGRQIHPHTTTLGKCSSLECFIHFFTVHGTSRNGSMLLLKEISNVRRYAVVHLANSIFVNVRVYNQLYIMHPSRCNP